MQHMQLNTLNTLCTFLNLRASGEADAANTSTSCSADALSS